MVRLTENIDCLQLTDPGLISYRIESGFIYLKKNEKMEEIIIYKFQLEVIAEALRIVANSYGCRKQKTCMDRQVSHAEQYAKNALKGEKDVIVRYGFKIEEATK